MNIDSISQDTWDHCRNFELSNMVKGNDPQSKVWDYLEDSRSNVFKNLENEEGFMAPYLRVAFDHKRGFYARGSQALSLSHHRIRNPSLIEFPVSPCCTLSPGSSSASLPGDTMEIHKSWSWAGAMGSFSSFAPMAICFSLPHSDCWQWSKCLSTGLDRDLHFLVWMVIT